MKNKLIVIVIITMMLFVTLTPMFVYGAETITRTVASGNDDATELGTGEFRRTATNWEVFAHDNTGGGLYRCSGARFTDIAIPRYAQILSVKFSVYCYDDDGMHCKVYLHDTDNSPNFLSNAHIISTSYRPRTSAYYTWNEDTGTGWHTENLSTSIVQEVIDRSGWSSGNALTFLFIAFPQAITNDFDGKSYEAGKPAKIEISYKIFPFTHDKDLNVNHETSGAPRTYPRGTSLPSGQWYTNINFNPDPSNYAKVGVGGYAYLRAYSYATFIPPICQGWSNAFFEQGRPPYCDVQLGKFKAGWNEENSVDVDGLTYDCFYYETANEHKLEMRVKITKRYVNQPFAFGSILVALLFQYRWADGSLSLYDEPAKTNVVQSVHYDIFLSRAWRKAGIYGEDSIGTEGWQWGDAYNDDLHVQYVVGQMDVEQWYTFSLDYGELLNKCKDIMFDAWDGRGGLPSGTRIILRDIQVSCEVIGSEMEVTVDYVRFVRV